jgi:hypothetical protein
MESHKQMDTARDVTAAQTQTDEEMGSPNVPVGTHGNEMHIDVATHVRLYLYAMCLYL